MLYPILHISVGFSLPLDFVLFILAQSYTVDEGSCLSLYLPRVSPDLHFPVCCLARVADKSQRDCRLAYERVIKMSDQQHL